jgi:hypothetical protein
MTVLLPVLDALVLVVRAPMESLTLRSLGYVSWKNSALASSHSMLAEDKLDRAIFGGGGGGYIKTWVKAKK